MTQGHAAAYNPSAKHKFEEANSKSVGTLYRYRNYSDQIVVVSDPTLENEVCYQYHITRFHQGLLLPYSHAVNPCVLTWCLLCREKAETVSLACQVARLRLHHAKDACATQ